MQFGLAHGQLRHRHPGFLFIEVDSSRKERINIFGQAALQLLQHSLLCRGTMNGSPLQRKVVVEAGEEFATVQIQLLQSFIQIERSRFLRRCSSARSFVPKSSSGSNETISASA